ncbi:MAG: lipoprotein, partial [Alphaproteobacteria bacterium]|nr:lipoprotein [Alphaproteobacteria bacterium]
MKKLLSLFVALVALSGCSTFGADGGLFSGADCESRLARSFAENATDTVFFAFDSSALS